MLGGPEGERALPPLIRGAAVVVEVARGGDVALLALVHQLGLGERRAPLPLAHGAWQRREEHRGERRDLPYLQIYDARGGAYTGRRGGIGTVRGRRGGATMPVRGAAGHEG